MDSPRLVDFLGQSLELLGSRPIAGRVNLRWWLECLVDVCSIRTSISHGNGPDFKVPWGATKRAQRSNTYVISCAWTMRSIAAEVSTQVPRRARSVATLVSVHVHEPSRAYTIPERYHSPPPPPWNTPEDLVQHLYVTSPTLNSSSCFKTPQSRNMYER